jgi:hypothetical protein
LTSPVVAPPVTATDSMSLAVRNARLLPSYDHTRWVGPFTPDVRRFGLGFSRSVPTIATWPVVST